MFYFIQGTDEIFNAMFEWSTVVIVIVSVCGAVLVLVILCLCVCCIYVCKDTEKNKVLLNAVKAELAANNKHKGTQVNPVYSDRYSKQIAFHPLPEVRPRGHVPGFKHTVDYQKYPELAGPRLTRTKKYCKRKGSSGNVEKYSEDLTSKLPRNASDKYLKKSVGSPRDGGPSKVKYQHDKTREAKKNKSDASTVVQSGSAKSKYSASFKRRSPKVASEDSKSKAPSSQGQTIAPTSITIVSESKPDGFKFRNKELDSEHAECGQNMSTKESNVVELTSLAPHATQLIKPH